MKWIKVEDRLPLLGEDVFVLTKNGKVSTNKMRLPRNCRGKALSNIPEWKGSSAFKDSIVAWMPVPSFDYLIK